MNAPHDALRAQFISYFAKAGHTKVPSSPLVPQGDPSLMFVNAGMVQFKDIFTGAQKAPYTRAVSAQKCMRVSGKHNDLEEVGRTARHHTLFEMLGNFSFGDYFKEEAISLAWRFIDQELGLNKDRLWITVFGGNSQVGADTEARALWRKISGLPDSRILDKDEKDNFWSMGDVGPCGPCTEIHYDQGQGPVNDADFESGRVMEIWNNVFMQYSRSAGGVMQPLPAPAVDTGMGLERVAALVAGVNSNYHTGLFMPLIDNVAALSGKAYTKSDQEDDVSMRVIADHARALAFLVADGIQPGNEGRGYVLRRIMRRAIRHGRRLGLSDVFMPAIAQTVVDVMGNAYPELNDASALIAKVAETEELSFRRTLDSGLKILGDALGTTLDHVAQGPKPVLSGEVVFKLYDTFGFPKDLTEVIAQERGISVDHAGFDTAMAEQQARSRSHSGKDAGEGKEVYQRLVQRVGSSSFIGYRHENEPLAEQAQGAPRWRRQGDWVEAQVTVRALIHAGQEVETLAPKTGGQAIFDHSPLYAEGGGQVGDAGRIVTPNGATADVENTTRPLPELHVAHVTTQDATLTVGDLVWVGYRASVRLQTRAHHSATHLLHHALRRILGDHVKQAGSLVDSTHLRFDFSHFSSLTPQELTAIENEVNARIEDHAPVAIEELALEEARGKGAVALFGEKYGERVRVISMGESIEFCGGTHAHNTGELGMLLITREQAVQSGVRRMEAEVGEAAKTRLARDLTYLTYAAALLGQQSAQEPDDVAHDNEAQLVFAAIKRSVKRIESLAQTPQVDEGPTWVVTAQALGLTALQLPETGRTRTQAIRNTWAALVQLTHAKAQEGAQIVTGLGTWDLGHVAAAYLTLMTTEREAERYVAAQASRQQATGAQDLVADAQTLGNGIKLVTHQVAGGPAGLKALADHIRQGLGSGVVALAAHEGSRVTLLVALTPDLTSRFAAGTLIRTLATHIDGKGGGRADMAQAGGTNAAGIAAAFAHLAHLLHPATA